MGDAGDLDHTLLEDGDDRSSDGEFSVDEDAQLKQEEYGSSQTSPSVASTLTSKNAAGGGGGSGKTPLHVQKRRRVTRACDECRRKKIKCDGKQPCTHCTIYSYECTYDQPSNRRRNPAPQYVENLERRVHRAETLLHILIPNLDLNDSGIDAAVAQGWIPGAPGRGNPTTGPPGLAAAAAARQPPLQPTPEGHRTPNGSGKCDTSLESMMRAVVQLDMDEYGHWDYHGHSSGLSFVRRMREQLGDLMGPETASTPFVRTQPGSQVLASPKSSIESPASELSPGSTDLPPKDYARQVCSNAVHDAATLLQVVHKPSFWQSFEHLYNTPTENYTIEDNKFLPIFHSAMALGHLFDTDDQSRLDKHGYENAIQQGFAHFKMARQLLDIADCRDISSIQAVIFMILFLQSSAKLSHCYTYVGIALRAALRMGLHRAHAGNFNPFEAELRKRVFWILRKMDIYVGAMLGLPQTLSDEDIDQEFPTEVDDEYITPEGLLPMPEGTVSMMTAFNAHTRIVQLLSKIVRKIYPIKLQTGSADRSYSVPFSTIRELESDLEEWKQQLPPILSPCPAPKRYIRVQQLLRLTYAHAQVMLYRPFLHFTAMEKRSKPIDQRAYACAASYVNVSRNIIHITGHMKQRGLLNGSFWFVMYTTFFAILSLVYFAAENPDNPTAQAIVMDAVEGKQTLEALATRSMAADRCTETLNATFQRLPEWMRKGQQNPMMARKRQLDASPQPPQPPGTAKTSSSFPDAPILIGHDTPPSGVKRAHTFPGHAPQVPASSAPSAPFDAPWPGSATSPYGSQPSTNGFDPHATPQWDDQNTPGTITNGMEQYAQPQAFANPALPDLSAMMFPTEDEPFGYPNQPLTTFENNQQVMKDDQYMNVQRTFSGVENASNVAPPRNLDDNLEAQFFVLLPHMHQKQQQQAMDMPQGAAGFNNGSMGVPTSAVNIPNGAWVNQPMPPDLSGINIQDIFGGAEWNPVMMDPGFQNQ